MARLIADLPEAEGRGRHQRSADGAGHRRTATRTQLNVEPAARHQQDRPACWLRVGGSPRAARDRRQPAGDPRRARRPREPQPAAAARRHPAAGHRADRRSSVTRPEILGTLSVGFLLDDALAAQLKQITGSDIAFGMDGQILAATLPRDDSSRRSRERLRTAGISRVAARRRGLRGAAAAARRRPTRPRRRSGPVALILRSRTEQLQFAATRFTPGSRVTAVVAVLLATLLSFAVARTITRPLAAITDVMREVAATGDLTRKIALRHGNRWDDEDARLLATTFNTLTDSIARFQREMSQKERLSSLGRLSTVIAHEVRNPLMIIKAALHTLRAAGRRRRRRCARRPPTSTRRSTRLNRIVNEVLDFARPIRFELGAGRPQRAVPRRRRPRRRGRAPAPPVRSRPRSALPPVDHRRRAAADRAGQHARQRAPRGRRDGAAGAGRAARRPSRRRASTATARRHHRRRSRRRHRPGRPAARLRSVLHDHARRHRPRSCRSPRTSSRARRHDRRRQRRRGAAPTIRIELPARRRSAAPTTHDRTAARSCSSTTKRRS